MNGVVEQEGGIVPTQPPLQGMGDGLNVNQALEEWKAYLKLTEEMLTPLDYQDIKGKKFKKKSAARKYARAFNISDELIEYDIIRDDDNNVQEATFLVRARLPSGRTSIGIGSCSRTERGFSKPNHDIPSTAHTRAKNRAIFDLVGSGEVSAEEVWGDEEAIENLKPKRRGTREETKPKEETEEDSGDKDSKKSKKTASNRKRRTRETTKKTKSKEKAPETPKADKAKDKEPVSEMPTAEKVSLDCTTDWDAERRNNKAVDYVVDVVQTAQMPLNNINVRKATDMLFKNDEISEEEKNLIYDLIAQPAKK